MAVIQGQNLVVVG
jgi:hypothetical protein